MKSVCACVFVLSLQLFVCGQSTSPCPGIFDYESDTDRDIFGIITLQKDSDQPVSSLELVVTLVFPDYYIVTREGHDGYIESLPTSQLLKLYNQRQPITYRLHHPVTYPLPKVIEVMVNGRMICQGPPVPRSWKRVTLRNTTAPVPLQIDLDNAVPSRPDNEYAVTWPTSAATTRSPPRPKVTTGSTPRPVVATRPTSRPEITNRQTSRPEATTRPTSRPEVTTRPTPRPEVATRPTRRTVVTMGPTPKPEVTTRPTPRPEVATRPTPRPAVTTKPTPMPEVTTRSTPRPVVTIRPTLRPVVTVKLTPRPVFTTRSTPRPVVTIRATLRPVVTVTLTPRPVFTTKSTPRPVVTIRPTLRPVVTVTLTPRPVFTTTSTPRPVVTIRPTPRPVVTIRPTLRPVATVKLTPRPVVTTTSTPRPDDRNSNISITKEECGVVDDGSNIWVPLINKGKFYERGEVPWLVAIYKSVNKNLFFICGGTLVSDRHVVTAAHCMWRRDLVVPMSEIVVKVGAHSLNDWSDDLTVTTKLMAATIHEEYNPDTLQNDILVLTLDKRIKFNRYSRPACLWSGDIELSNVVGVTGTVAGWGARAEWELEKRDNPQMVRVPIVSSEECRASNAAFQTLTYDNTLCAGDRNSAGPCTGDSGGGLYLLVGGKWRLRGVVSVSLRKENAYALCNLNEYVVFTDAAQFLPWIRNILSERYYD